MAIMLSETRRQSEFERVGDLAVSYMNAAAPMMSAYWSDLMYDVDRMRLMSGTKERVAFCIRETGTHSHVDATYQESVGGALEDRGFAKQTVNILRSMGVATKHVVVVTSREDGTFEYVSYDVEYVDG